ncbi:MAG: Brp/Blh family beta-carotene 15,15'-dioxygenase [Bacteroidota bacterium]
MTKSIFIFIAVLLLSFPLAKLYGDFTIADQLLLSFPLILFLGLPHGAIDNVLFLRNKSEGNIKFITVYVMMVLAYIALWFLSPTTAYILFLLLSAYHFGQSQFSHYLKRSNRLIKLLYFSWGVTLLSGLVYFNQADIKQISASINFIDIKVLHGENLMFLLFLISSISAGILLILMTIKGILTTETLAMETLVLFLIQVCFVLMPLFLGFTLYFVVLHSLKVLQEEYTYLFKVKSKSSLLKFIKLLAPLSILSIFGTIALFSLIYFELLPIGYGYLFLIIISSITFPHIFVMEKFYSKHIK